MDRKVKMAFILYLRGALNGPESEGKEVREGEKSFLRKRKKRKDGEILEKAGF